MLWLGVVLQVVAGAMVVAGFGTAVARLSLSASVRR
ncbi:exported hypothetical protein [Mesorhizobium metallidurans STM 2683]|uniref:Uncharacterized protein n=1 Tax=Mesorhizobium metallidurans STM 2683 TaxID=1297569 RepID=M5EVC5_9HYPH|nr:exported hypothetical protein [Mesorhizobium metallidurans STM 2683]